jgi:hypothetical protein
MLADQSEHLYWIPVMENPNRVIPAALTAHGKKSLFPVQERPWPLKAETYEEWKASLVSDMIDVLDNYM